MASVYLKEKKICHNMVLYTFVFRSIQSSVIMLEI